MRVLFSFQARTYLLVMLDISGIPLGGESVWSRREAVVFIIVSLIICYLIGETIMSILNLACLRESGYPIF